MKANIPFSVLTMVHEGNTNDHDTIYAKKFCEANGIRQQFVNLNMQEFLTSGINKYIEQGYQSKNVFRYLQLFLLETITNMNGCAVLGGGEQLYTTDKNGKVNLYIEPSHLNSLIWCERNNVLHFPYFYQTTPEIIASYINQECVSFLINKPEYFLRKDMTNTSLLLKMMVYHFYIEGLTPRSKFHGFENIQQLREDTQKVLTTQFPNIQYVGISVDEVKRQLAILN
jgi:hypothetical protein